jgi:hypothetical protein
MLFGEAKGTTVELGAVLHVTETIFRPGGVPLVADDLSFKLSTLDPEQIPTLDLLQVHHHVLLGARDTHAYSRTIPGHVSIAHGIRIATSATPCSPGIVTFHLAVCSLASSGVHCGVMIDH